MPDQINKIDNAATALDLISCEWEPIHIPGRVQSHGFLIATNRHSQVITYASNNVEKFLSVSVSDILNKDLSHFLNVTGFQTGHTDLLQLLKADEDPDFEALNPVVARTGNTKYNLIVHVTGNFLVFEFEPMDISGDSELQRMVGLSLSRILEAKTLSQTLQFAARQVKEIIGYDRVMVYKFWDDGHGEVVAEEKNEDLEPFLGLHYPASDIPKQARELYKVNLVRIIADVHSDPAALIVSDKNYEAEPLDLTQSTLRAVSPIHIEYLKNMGVQASFSISIVLKDKLWGLIACHNNSAKFIDFKARNSAKLIGKILSSSLEYREEQETKEMGRKFDAALQKIVSHAIKEWNIADSLVSHEDNVLKLTNATGAALLFENNIYTLGVTPSTDDIHALVKWMKLSGQPSLFHTDQLAKQFPPAASYADIASGLLNCTLSKELNECILWFKPELKKIVTWAGNPDKPVEVGAHGSARLSPRRSFDLWSQEVEGTSAPWTAAEVGTVMKLREEVVHLISQKANQIRKLNEELQKAYDELDTFSFTISHDLKTPLATIKNYTEILLEDFQDLPGEVKEILQKVVRNADRMNLLIKEVLSYSRIDRTELRTIDLDMNNMINNIVNDLRTAFHAEKSEIIIKNTPALRGDETMIYQVFTNIIGNAVKYSAKVDKPIVEINGEDNGNEVIYAIKDNGIGIDMTYGNMIFVLFKRLENARKYEGTGVGLAIVKRILEKHRAKIWYESPAEGGTIFYLSFQRNP